METLKSKQICLYTHDERGLVCNRAAGLPISSQPGHDVASYAELLEKIASLNFHNPSLKLFFRGQTKDHFNYNDDGKPVRSNLYPSILRSLPTKKSRRSSIIKIRFKVLEQADSLFKDKILEGYIHRHMFVRWAILQHYEVCDTPLLDVTDSLQVALSFAASGTGPNGYLYVLGLPHQNGSISVSVESMTQVVDLSKLCPPEVSRPHFQSAFLLADYPTAVYPEDMIQQAPRVKANFSCRLLTKFNLNGLNNWICNEFFPVPKDILFPNHRDKWFAILSEIKKIVSPNKANPADAKSHASEYKS